MKYLLLILFFFIIYLKKKTWQLLSIQLSILEEIAM